MAVTDRHFLFCNDIIGIILDTGIGDTFNARVAGNIANDDLLDSLEFACAVAGAKLILVMGHTLMGCD